MPDFIRRLEEGVLIGDGATGTQLEPHAADPAKGYEILNATNPDAVRGVAAAYVAAGSGMVSTNTFGGSRLKLEAVGHGERTAELNRAGACLAREGAGDDLLVAGSIGPTGRFIEPLGDLSVDDAIGGFAEQVAALADGGVDLILIETMMALEEAVAAVKGARSATDLPIAATMAFTMSGKTMFGVSPEQAAAGLTEAGVVAVGLNCGELTLDRATELIAEFAEAADVPIIAQLNAGIPELVDGVARFTETPESMGAFARRFVDAGAVVVGGCCGSTPAHISAMAAALAI